MLTVAGKFSQEIDVSPLTYVAVDFLDNKDALYFTLQYPRRLRTYPTREKVCNARYGVCSFVVALLGWLFNILF